MRATERWSAAWFLRESWLFVGSRSLLGAIMDEGESFGGYFAAKLFPPARANALRVGFAL